MKSLFTVAALAVGLQFANAQSKPAQTSPAATPSKPASTAVAPAADPAAPRADASSFKWSEETWDFGTIPQGVPVTHAFKFTNVGKEPLVISKVDKSCGCTTPKWTVEPVMPGQEGHVTATFNAAAAGGFNKTVTVHSNAGDKVLHIKGTVTPKEGAVKDEHAGHNQQGDGQPVDERGALLVDDHADDDEHERAHGHQHFRIGGSQAREIGNVRVHVSLLMRSRHGRSRGRALGGSNIV